MRWAAAWTWRRAAGVVAVGATFLTRSHLALAELAETAASLLVGARTGREGELLVRIKTSDNPVYDQAVGLCSLHYVLPGAGESLVYETEGGGNSEWTGGGCGFVVREMPGLPAVTHCSLVSLRHLCLWFAGCLAQGTRYSVVLRVQGMTELLAVDGILGELTVEVRMDGTAVAGAIESTLLEQGSTSIAGEVRGPAHGLDQRDTHIESYLLGMDTHRLHGTAVTLAVHLVGHPSPLEDAFTAPQLVLGARPVTLWNLLPGATHGQDCGQAFQNVNISGNPTCRWLRDGPTLAINAVLVQLDHSLDPNSTATFNLQVFLPRGGAVATHAYWRVALLSELGDVADAIEVPVLLPPALRGAVRSPVTLQGARSSLWLDLDFGVDLCIVDPDLMEPGSVEVEPPQSMNLPNESVPPEVEDGVAPPVDCTSESDLDGGATVKQHGCRLHFVPANWRRGLPCAYRGVVYTLQWEDVTQPRAAAGSSESTSWRVTVIYPDWLGRWMQTARGVAASTGTLPFAVALPSSDVLGDVWRGSTAPTPILVRLLTRDLAAYQDFRTGISVVHMAFSWPMQGKLRFAPFSSCQEILLEFQGLPSLAECTPSMSATAAVGVQLKFHSSLRGHSLYDIVLPVVATAEAFTALTPANYGPLTVAISTQALDDVPAFLDYLGEPPTSTTGVGTVSEEPSTQSMIQSVVDWAQTFPTVKLRSTALLDELSPLVADTASLRFADGLIVTGVVPIAAPSITHRELMLLVVGTPSGESAQTPEQRSRISIHPIDVVLGEPGAATAEAFAADAGLEEAASVDCADPYQLCRLGSAAALPMYPQQIIVCDDSRVVQLLVDPSAEQIMLQFVAYFGSHLTAGSGSTGLGHCAGIATDFQRLVFVADQLHHRVVSLGIFDRESSVAEEEDGDFNSNVDDIFTMWNDSTGDSDYISAPAPTYDLPTDPTATAPAPTYDLPTDPATIAPVSTTGLPTDPTTTAHVSFGRTSRNGTASVAKMPYLASYGHLIAGATVFEPYVATDAITGLSSPSGVAWASLPEPCLYVADTGNHRVVQLRVMSTGGSLEYSAHFGVSGAAGSDSLHLNTPLAVTVGEGLAVYVLDAGNKRIVVMNVGETLGAMKFDREFGLEGPVLSGPTLLHAVFQSLPGIWVSYGTSGGARIIKRLLLQEPFDYTLEQMAAWDSGRTAMLRASFRQKLGSSSSRAWQPVGDTALLHNGAPVFTLIAFPMLAWDLAPQAPFRAILAVPPLCEMEVELLESGGILAAPCDFESVGAGMRFGSLRMHMSSFLDHVGTGFVAKLSIRLPSEGVATNPFSYGAWAAMVLLPFRSKPLQSGSPDLRGRRLAPPDPPAILGARPHPSMVASPLVVFPANARLSAELTVDFTLDPGAQLLGSSPLPAVVRVTLPEGFSLPESPAVSYSGMEFPLPVDVGCALLQNRVNVCEITLPRGVSLASGVNYGLRFEGLHAPKELSVTSSNTWHLETKNSGPLTMFSGPSSHDGIIFRQGLAIPTSWAFFPYVSASHVAVGWTEVSLNFRAYTTNVTTISVEAPITTRFPAKCINFQLAPTLSILCRGSDSNVVALSLDKGSFDPETTYLASLQPIHLATTPSPREGTEVMRAGVMSWAFKFLHESGDQLAYASPVHGYPVWPRAIDFAGFEVLTRTPGSLATSSREVFSVLFSTSTSIGLGGDAGAVLWLYAPFGYSIDCSVVETSDLFKARRVEQSLEAELNVADTACAPSTDLPSRPWAALLLGPPHGHPGGPVLRAGAYYSFAVSVTTPSSPRTDVYSMGGEVDARTWYLSVVPIMPLERALFRTYAATPETYLLAANSNSSTYCGGTHVMNFGLRYIELSLASGSATLSGEAVLSVSLIPRTLVSSPPAPSGSKARIEIYPPEAYQFTSSCQVGPTEASEAEAAPLPHGSTCEVKSEALVFIHLAPSTALVPGVAYAFLIWWLRMPADAANTASSSARRLQSNSTGASMAVSADAWNVATINADGKLAEPFYFGGGAFWPYLVPSLASFQYVAPISPDHQPRLGQDFIAQFMFAPPSTFGTPIGFLRLGAPANFAFHPQEDCSPDSAAPIMTTPDGNGTSGEALASVSANVLNVGWCLASPASQSQGLLPRSDISGARVTAYPKRSLRSALVALPRPITDFSAQYTFRVRVQHPTHRPDGGDDTWSLSLLDEEAVMVAQTSGLQAYDLVGDMDVRLFPSSRLASEPKRLENNVVAILFQLSSGLPNGGVMRLRLGGGDSVEDGFLLPAVNASDESAGPVCNISLTEPAFAEGVDANMLPASTDSVCEGFKAVTLTSATAVLSATRYVFWVTVVNPFLQPVGSPSIVWEMRTLTSGSSGEVDVNASIPTFDFVDEPLQFFALSTVPEAVLADRPGTVLVFFVLPTEMYLTPGSQIWIVPPATFIYEPDNACKYIVGTSEADSMHFASMPDWLIHEARNAWIQMRPPEMKHKMVAPLPPSVTCATGGLGDDMPSLVTLTLPGRLAGDAPYTLALEVLTPSLTPVPASRNRWRLQLHLQVNFAHRMAYDAWTSGFHLVPKLRDESILPSRSMSDAYFKQTPTFPPGASMVAIVVDFNLPHIEGQLGDFLNVRIEAPQGFEVGSGTTQRICTTRELYVGREILDADTLAQCSVESVSLMVLKILVQPEDVYAQQAVLGSDGYTLLPLTLVVFPVLPASSIQGLEAKRWNLGVSSCVGDIDTASCFLLARSTNLPTWSMYGYLHVDRVIVDYPPGEGEPLPGGPEPWAGEQAEWAGRRLVVLRFQGVRLSEVLSVGSSLRLNAPSGYAFHSAPLGADPSESAFISSSLLAPDLPALDEANCRVLHVPMEGETDALQDILVLHFVEPLPGDEQISFELAAQSPPDAAVVASEGSQVTHWRLETVSEGGVLLDVQQNIGRWDRVLQFPFVLLGAVEAAPPGEVFDLAVYFRMPEGVGLDGGKGLRNFLKILAPVFFEFSACDGREGDNRRFEALPANSLVQDTSIVAALLRPLPDYTACSAGGSALSVALGGRRRGSGSGGLKAGSTYAFAWGVRIVSGRKVPYRPRAVPGSTGENVADLLFGDEPASPDSVLTQRNRWIINAESGKQSVYSSTVEVSFQERSDSTVSVTGSSSTLSGEARLVVRDLTPVWTLASAPYFGHKSLVYIIFSIGSRAFPPNSRLRLSIMAPDPTMSPALAFASCEEQRAAHSRQAWLEPLEYTSRSDEYWGEQEDVVVDDQQVGPDVVMLLVQFSQCMLTEDPQETSAGENSTSGANATNATSSQSTAGDLEAWKSQTAQVVTIHSTTLLMPPTQQYLLPLIVWHTEAPAGFSGGNWSASALLHIEVLDDQEDRVLARSHDLAAYPVVRKMELTRWDYSSAYVSATNTLDFEFRPATDVFSTSNEPRVLGFTLMAPATYRFVAASCRDMRISRRRIDYDLMSGENYTQVLLFKEPPSCEVTASRWLAETGYYQHQLVVYMPSLVEFLADVYYRIQVSVLNPPFPLSHALMERVVTGRDTPKLSTSPYLLPMLSTWRVFTFSWDAGDAGGGGAPFIGASGSAVLGRVAGVRKVDEVAWNGFDLVML